MRLLEARRGLLIEMAADLVVVGLLEGARLAAWLARVAGSTAQDIGSQDNGRALAPPEEAGSHDTKREIKRAAVAQSSGGS